MKFRTVSYRPDENEPLAGKGTYAVSYVIAVQPDLVQSVWAYGAHQLENSEALAELCIIQFPHREHTVLGALDEVLAHLSGEDWTDPGELEQ